MSGIGGGILVTGGRGMLAGALRRRLERDASMASGRSAHLGERCWWTDLPELDITDGAAVREYVERVRPGVVVNCAALTDVDGCESREAEAMRINGEAVGHLARVCNGVGALLVQISTDFVFSGERAGAYVESDATGPLSVYGRSKLLGEQMAAESRRHLIVRTSWLYGPGGRNFVAAICRQALVRDELRVVDDQRGCPTYTDDLAEALVGLLEAGAEGVFHASGRESCSWHGFAVEIVRQLRPEVRVSAISSAELNRPARRPANSVLDCEKLQRVTGYRLPGYIEALPGYMSILKTELAGRQS